jgi:hypothetical protein
MSKHASQQIVPVFFTNVIVPLCPFLAALSHLLMFASGDKAAQLRVLIRIRVAMCSMLRIA